MTPSTDTPQRSAGTGPEAERQLASSVERHREVLASMQELGRPEASQHVAVKAVGRAVHLVAFALRHATECGVPLERLVELTGWEPEVVSEAVARAGDPLQPPAPSLVAQLAPAGLDPVAVAEAAASVEASARLQELTQRILADADAGDDAWSPTAADLVDLYERMEREWRSWREVRSTRGP
jgi:hypothetical protein